MKTERPASLTYCHGEFFLDVAGDHVLCAVTNVAIPLDELKYWDVDLQEAYASPMAAIEKKKRIGLLK